VGGNDPVGQREFDQYTRASDRRLDALERWREAHQRQHGEDDDEAREDRRWSWQQLAAWAAVAAVLVTAWFQAVAGR
jgi:hypothetical protein